MRKLSVVAIAMFFFISACTKIESTDIGNGIIGPLNSVTTFDITLEVVTANFIDENSPRVYKSDENVIGIINNDPLFGTTVASSFFQLKPDFFPFYFSGTDLKADSVVLFLKYQSLFGDSTINQDWDVREISQKLNPDSSYATNASVTTGALLGSRRVNIVGQYDSAGTIPIRIKLNQSLATRFFGYDSTTNSGAYFNDSIFRERFAGLAIVPVAGSGNSLIGINLLDTSTKLAFYYTSKASASATKRDTLISSFRFTLGTATAKASANANLINRNRTASQVASYLNTGKNDEVFIQTSPGIIATIKVPGLRSFPNVIVHRAELIAEQDPHNILFDQTFFAPRYLLLSAYDSVNKYKTNIRNDFTYSQDAGPNIASFGGFRFNKNVSPFGTVAAYNFDLTRYVQGIVTRKDSSFTLRLSAPSNDSLFYTAPYPATGSLASTMLYLSPAVANVTAFGRVRLGGGSLNSNVRMRLRIIYSKI